MALGERSAICFKRSSFPASVSAIFAPSLKPMTSYATKSNSFATAKDASAPGQVPLDDLKKVLEVLHD